MDNNEAQPKNNDIAIAILWADRARHFEHYKKMDSKLDEILNRIEINGERLAKLPCETRKAVADKTHEGFEKDSRNQWIMIGALWSVISAVAYCVFEAWLRIWSGNRAP